MNWTEPNPFLSDFTDVCTKSGYQFTVRCGHWSCIAFEKLNKQIAWSDQKLVVQEQKITSGRGMSQKLPRTISGKETEKRTVHVMFQEDDENVDRDGAEAVFVRVYFK